MKAGKVFYAVLNMGLGHATRSLPIIREFLERNWEVLIGSNGRALEFLKTELPGVSFIITPDYQIKYSRSAWLLPKLIVQIPRLVSKINQEQAFCNKVVADFLPDLIISDHCYGISHERIPSFFISHQIYFAMPNGMGSFGPLVARINFMFHKNYLRVIVPDLADSNQGLLSGRLSRLPKNSVNYAFGGILSSITRREPKETIDLLVSISGPEPQRTLFEQKILQQIEALPGRKVVVLGKSESIQTLRNTPELMVFSHLPRREIGRLFNQAKLIVSRPGYSTLMELVELGKQALLVPTPGQTEQHALAKHAMENNWFYAVDQNKLDLVRDVEGAKDYAGLFKPNVTAWSVRNIFNNILNLR
jgi:predicted glycosyltransferase